MFQGPFDSSIISRARKNRLVKISFVNIRDFAGDSYQTVDDRPFGGGKGMILKVDVIDKCLSNSLATSTIPKSETRIILLDPTGNQFNQTTARRLTAYKHLILICGHYEGVDERVRQLIDEEISVGDYILTGGELAAMTVTDCVLRLVPGVLKSDESTENETFTYLDGRLEYPQYTRPQEYKGMKVPEVLLNGDHAAITRWRKTESAKKTLLRRPELIKADHTTGDISGIID